MARGLSGKTAHFDPAKARDDGNLHMDHPTMAE
jgi:hypothetical protein